MKTEYLNLPNGAKIAYTYHKGSSDLTNFFVSGFRSHKQGGKAESLYRWTKEKSDDSFVCFDYRGHGLSDGDFSEFTFRDWLEDLKTVFHHFSSPRNIIIASSMGAWLSFHLAEEEPEKIKGIITIATATDFTRFIESRISQKQRQELEDNGFFSVISPYTGETYPFSQKLIDAGHELHMLHRKIAVTCPVIMNHSMLDKEIPWSNTTTTAEQLISNNIEVLLTKSGDHRLSSEKDLERYCRQIKQLSFFVL